ncbi:MAG: hydrogenase [Lentisphaerae bacterium]|nr:hydrogenase [Lentisphaerota bacterium]
MSEKNYLLLANASMAKLSDIPRLEMGDFRADCLRAVKEENCRISAFFVLPGEGKEDLLTAILADPEQKKFRIMQSAVRDGKFPSLTAEFPGFNRFEREIFENNGILPENHPNLKPLRFTGKNDRIGEMEFFSMQGKAIHEVAVGPVHAGVIEPGHFRFQCMGETVYSLEISLGYQHRGIEKMLTGMPDNKTAHLIETAAGDSSIAAAWNYAKLTEALGGITVSSEVEAIRQYALELERCANHIGDLGALAGDVAFLPTASFCGRIRGEYLNMTAELCGNRFGRNFIIPGGIRFGVDSTRLEKISKWLHRIAPELWNALELMFNSPTVLDRFENTGSVSKDDALALGLTGVAARACGIDINSARDLPGKNAFPEVIDCRKFSGDVISRAAVRYEELKKSHDFLFGNFDDFKTSISPAERKNPALANDAIAVAVTEAWRGELCHVAVTGNRGEIKMLKIVDPSFHNWEGLAMALRNEEISNFPICNKSFNLSYCGHDL